jgi:hypothetical protein
MQVRKRNKGRTRIKGLVGGNGHLNFRLQALSFQLVPEEEYAGLGFKD